MRVFERSPRLRHLGAAGVLWVAACGTDSGAPVDTGPPEDLRSDPRPVPGIVVRHVGSDLPTAWRAADREPFPTAPRRALPAPASAACTEAAGAHRRVGWRDGPTLEVAVETLPGTHAYAIEAGLHVGRSVRTWTTAPVAIDGPGTALLEVPVPAEARPVPDGPSRLQVAVTVTSDGRRVEQRLLPERSVAWTGGRPLVLELADERHSTGTVPRNLLGPVRGRAVPGVAR